MPTTVKRAIIPATGVLGVVLLLILVISSGADGSSSGAEAAGEPPSSTPSWEQVVQEQGAEPEEWFSGPNGEPVFCGDDRIKLPADDFDRLGLGIHPDYPDLSYTCAADGIRMVPVERVEN